MTSIAAFVEETKKAFMNIALRPAAIDEQLRAIHVPAIHVPGGKCDP